MPVRLQLDDGTVREYPVVNPTWGGSPSVTLCGAGDCEHPECALELARKMKEVARKAIIGLSSLEIFIIAGILLLTYPFEHGFASASRFQLLILLLTSLLLVYGIWYSRGLLSRFGPATRDLEEYIQSRTVEGRQARQVHPATTPTK